MNETGELLVCVDGVNLLGENICTIHRNVELRFARHY
jgi:hypothetical protein